MAAAGRRAPALCADGRSSLPTTGSLPPAAVDVDGISSTRCTCLTLLAACLTLPADSGYMVLGIYLSTRFSGTMKNKNMEVKQATEAAQKLLQSR